LLCTLGYEKGGQKEGTKKRKPLESMLFYNRYKEDENK
jgi:hypothetical protein